MVSVSDVAKATCRFALAASMCRHTLQTQRIAEGKDDPRNYLAALQAIRTWCDRKGNSQLGIDVTWITGALNGCMNWYEGVTLGNEVMQQQAIDTALQNLVLQVGSVHPKAALVLAGGLLVREVSNLTHTPNNNADVPH